VQFTPRAGVRSSGILDPTAIRTAQIATERHMTARVTPAQKSPLFFETLRALLVPRRLVPLLLIATPLLVAQVALSPEPLAGPIGLALCASFCITAPFLYRWLFPMDDTPSRTPGVVRFGIYVAFSVVVVYVVGGVVPDLLGMRFTFLTDPWSLVVSCALFVVGGWGLGRDVELEQSLTRTKERASALEREKERAELLALRSHLDPHFLFNTLNAIAEWCRQDGEAAERGILELARMLRSILEGTKGTAWPLERELDLVKSLFELHLFRDPTLYTLVWKVQDRIAIELPPMLLLPIAENAVTHGPLEGSRGELSVEVSADDERVTIAIENPGRFRGRRAEGEGLSMIERRLALAYEGRARFVIENVGTETEPRTRATIVVPKHHSLEPV
jgi:two-component system sensor histidine kinase AlgZ